MKITHFCTKCKTGVFFYPKENIWVLIALKAILKPNLKSYLKALIWKLKTEGKENLNSQAIKFDLILCNEDFPMGFCILGLQMSFKIITYSAALCVMAKYKIESVRPVTWNCSNNLERRVRNEKQRQHQVRDSQTMLSDPKRIQGKPCRAIKDDTRSLGDLGRCGITNRGQEILYWLESL